jgi:PAS domain S-box-containing protein
MDWAQDRMKLIYQARLWGCVAGSVGALALAGLINRPGVPYVLAAALFECLINQPHFLRRLKLNLRPRDEARLFFTLDIAMMTFSIHFLGSYNSGPLVAAYLFILLFASVVLGGREAFYVAAIGLVAYSILLLLEGFQFIGPPPRLWTGDLTRTSAVAYVMILVFIFLMPAFIGAQIYRVVVRQEKSLLRSVERYERLLHEMGEAVIVINPDGTVHEANPRAAELFQREPQWLVDKRFVEIFAPESAAEFAVLLQNVAGGDRLQAKNWRLPLPDGGERIVEINASPYPRDSGPPAAFVILRDVTDQRRLEAELRRYSEELELRVEHRTAELEESREIYLALFEKAAVPLCWLDPQGVLQSGNKNFHDLIGRAKDQEGQLALVTILADPAERERVSETLVRHRQGYEAARRLELDIRRGDEVLSTEWFIHFNPLTDQLLVSIIDLTERKRAEEALKESEERYRTLVQTTPNAITVSDQDGKVIMINRQGLELYGADSEDELLGRSVFDLIAPQDRERALANVELLLEHGSTRDIEYRFPRKDGSFYIGESSAAVIHDAKGQPVAVISVVRDITERKRAEEALRESEERYRTLVETSPDAITVSDLNGKIIMSNASSAELWGSDNVHEIIGRSVFAFIHPEDRQRAIQTSMRMWSEGTIALSEYRFMRKDGSFYQGEITSSVIRDAAGKPLAFIGVVRDITERKRAEDRLRESEERYRSLLNASPDPILVSDMDGSVRMASRQALVFAGGTDEADMLGKNIYDFVAPQDRAKARADSIQILKTGAIHNQEYQLLTLTGAPYEGEISSVVVRDAQGRPAGFINVIRDVTARKRAEAALQQSEERYRATVDSMVDMIHVVDRDLRIVFFNEAFQQLSARAGLSNARVGATVAEAFPFLGPEVFAEYRRVFATGEAVTTEEFNALGDRDYYTETRKIPVRDRGEVTRVVTVIRDISRRKVLEQEIARHREHLEEQVRERTAELRTANDQLLLEVQERKQAEEALRVSQDRYRLLAENVSDVIWTADIMTLKINYVSPAVIRLRGYTPDEVINQRFREILTPSSRQVLRQVVAEETELEKQGADPSRVRTIELERYRKDGSTVWTEDHITFLREADGHVTGLLGVTRDITRRKQAEDDLRHHQERLEEEILHRTRELVEANASLERENAERRRAEEALRRSEEKFRSMIENASDLVSIVDASGKIVYTSPSAEKIFGYKPEEMIGTNAFAYVVPDQLRKLAQRWEQGVNRPGAAAALEMKITHKDGSLRIIEAVARSMVDNPEIGGFIVNSRDVTERRRAEDALRDSENKLRSLLMNSPDFIGIIDRNDRLLFLNRSTTDQPVDPLIGHNLYDIIPEDQHPALRNLLTSFFQSTDAVLYQTVAIIDRWFEIRSVPIPVPTGEEAVMVIASEITRRKRLEAAQQQMLEQLNQAEQMAAVGQIAAGVVHEMNSPLTAISYYAQALTRQRAVAAKERDKVQKIVESADRISKLLSRVMNYASTRQAEIGPVNLNAVVRQVLDAIGHVLETRPQARIRLELQADLPPINGAADQIYDLVSNLIINALQSIPEAGGNVTVATRADAGQIILEISDSGAGINPEDLPKIFTPFFTRRKGGEGTGLGLAIVRRVVSLHHGDIKVQSQPGQGSTFTVTLPPIPSS